MFVHSRQPSKSVGFEFDYRNPLQTRVKIAKARKILKSARDVFCNWK